MLLDSTKVDENGKIVESLIEVRKMVKFYLWKRNKVDLIDISSQMVMGVAASLIPFLEHDDANRALMGSNMMRQAVPLIKTKCSNCWNRTLKNSCKKMLGKQLKLKSWSCWKADAKNIYISGEDENGAFIDYYK